MIPFFRKLSWLMQRGRKEEELREELQFHLDEEVEQRQAEGLAEDQANRAAHLDLGNVTTLQESTRALWTWTFVEQFLQDLRYALRTMINNPAFTTLVVLSLALGIGANTAIFSFMDSILLRALPVSDPSSLVVLNWRSKVPAKDRNENISTFVMHAMDGSTYEDSKGMNSGIFPFPAFELFRDKSGSVFSSVFAYYPSATLNVVIKGHADVAKGEYVSGDYFRGLCRLSCCRPPDRFR